MVFSLLGLPGLYNPLNPGVGIPGQAMPPVGPMGQPQGGMPMPTAAPNMQMPMGQGAAMAPHMMPPVPTPPQQPPNPLQQMLGAGGGMQGLLGGLGRGQQGLGPQQAQAAGVDVSKANLPGFVSGLAGMTNPKGPMTPDMIAQPQGNTLTAQVQPPQLPPQNWWELGAGAFGGGTPWG